MSAGGSSEGVCGRGHIDRIAAAAVALANLSDTQRFNE
jgi:hypothetical protein